MLARTSGSIAAIAIAIMRTIVFMLMYPPIFLIMITSYHINFIDELKLRFIDNPIQWQLCQLRKSLCKSA